MSTYKEEDTWIDKMLALAVITLPAGIALMPVPKVDLEGVALGVFVVLAGLGGLFVLRSGWLVKVFLMKGTVFCVVAASAALGALFGTQAWLPSALAWALLGAGAWLALLLTLIVCRAVAWVVLSPVIWLAQHIGFKSAPAHCGSYASPSPRRYNAPTGPGAGYAAAAAGAATGYAGAQAWDMLDPLNPMNPASLMNPLNPLNPANQLTQLHETSSLYPPVNTNGFPMNGDSGVDVINHAYGDPAPIFETPSYAPSYDYSSSNCGGGCNTGGGFDF